MSQYKQLRAVAIAVLDAIDEAWERRQVLPTNLEDVELLRRLLDQEDDGETLGAMTLAERLRAAAEGAEAEEGTPAWGAGLMREAADAIEKAEATVISLLQEIVDIRVSRSTRLADAEARADIEKKRADDCGATLAGKPPPWVSDSVALRERLEKAEVLPTKLLNDLWVALTGEDLGARPESPKFWWNKALDRVRSLSGTYR